MKLITYRRKPGAEPEPGVQLADVAVSLGPLGYRDMLSVLAANDAARESIREFLDGPPPGSAVTRLDEITLLAPVPRPPKFICVGLNYRDHAAESKSEIPNVPTIFSKFSNCVIAPGEAIVLPKNSTRPDYEAEFAFVIGRGGRHIAAEDWKRHVAGYTIVNDVSARDFQKATSQWLMGKTFDTFAPMGPWITTADEIGDPHALDIRLTINGELMQNSNTRELIFGIPALVEYLSSVVTLEPGDIVSTGTPAGVGFARRPPRWLRPGDEVVIAIQGLGELRNPVVAEAQ
ncbi:MAG: fumarylacetoacetate hydrolase family protein [Bryobacteraceae bacterium]|jgi:2-keto-4-pentenoate hydratase/2-oxohepta-3-ene-1,7-dioic acid hydratase in catechol pathway